LIAFMLVACVSAEEEYTMPEMPEMPSGDWAAIGAATVEGDCPMCAMGLDVWFFKKAGAAFAPKDMIKNTPTSHVEIGAECKLTFANDKNTFGGKGLDVKGQANFASGVTKLNGPLNSTGFMDMAESSTLEIMKNDKPSVIGGTGIHTKGKVDISEDAELLFDGPLALDVGGSLNVTTGALVHFGEVPAGKIHFIGGEGIEAKGQVEIKPGSDVAFAGPCKVDGAGKVNITKNGKVSGLLVQ
jgi:hypothetical protein